jgi:hypothetical protein
MGKLRIGRPSPAMIVAVLALVMASIGTGIAAFQLPRNSVGTKHIRKNAVKVNEIAKNAVTGAKVRRGTLTGADINLSKLGVVPDASHAAVADVAEVARGITAPEPVHVVGAPGQPPFAPGAGNIGLLPESGIALPPVSFYKDREGIVRLEGVGKPGVNGVVFHLPPGFRPAAGTVQVFEIETSEETGRALKGIVVFGSNMRDGLGNDLSGAVTSLGSTLLSGVSFRAAS